MFGQNSGSFQQSAPAQQAPGGFNPNPATMQTLVNYLSGMNSNIESMINQSQKGLQKFKEQAPDAPLYLAHAFACQPQIATGVRMQAGLTLKSALTQKKPVYDQQILLNALQMVILALKEQDANLRRTAGTVAASFVDATGLENSFTFIAALAGALDVSQPQVQLEGTVDCLLKIIENNEQKCGLPEFESKMQEILEKLFIFTGKAIQAQNINPEIRANILKFTLGIAKILAKQNDRIFSQKNLLQLFIQALTTAAQSPDNAIKCEVIEGFSSVLDMQVMKQADPSIQPFLLQISQFILSCMDETKVLGQGAGEVIREAMVFWQDIGCNRQFCDNALPGILQHLIPALINMLIMSDIDLLQYVDLLDDDDQEDQDKDVTPAHLHGKEDKEDEDDDYAEAEGIYTIRKASANALSTLSKIKPNEVAALALPAIKEKLDKQGDTNWSERESGIFALSILAQPCIGAFNQMNALNPILEQVFNIVVFVAQQQEQYKQIPSASLNQQQQQLISHMNQMLMMAYYALGQYAVYISGPIDQVDIDNGLYSGDDLKIPRAPNNQALDSTIQALLQGMANKKKNLQKSACSALEMIILQASRKMLNYAQVLIPVLNQAFTYYRRSNTRLLCNIVTALSDAVGKGGLLANEAQLLKELMTMLQQKLQDGCSLDDTVLQPIILETVQHIVNVVEFPGFTPFIGLILQRSITIMRQQIELEAIDLAKFQRDEVVEGKNEGIQLIGFIDDPIIPQTEFPNYQAASLLFEEVVEALPDEQTFKQILPALNDIKSVQSDKLKAQFQQLGEQVKNTTYIIEKGLQSAGGQAGVHSQQTKLQIMMKEGEDLQEFICSTLQSWSLSQLLAAGMSSSSSDIRLYTLQLVDALVRKAAGFIKEQLDVQKTASGSFTRVIRKYEGQSVDEQIIQIQQKQGIAQQPLLAVIIEQTLRNIVPQHCIPNDSITASKQSSQPLPLFFIPDLNQQSKNQNLFFVLSEAALRVLGSLFITYPGDVLPGVQQILTEIIPMLKINAVIDEITRRQNSKNQVVQIQQQQLGIGVDGKAEAVPNAATHADSISFEESAYFGERLSETLGKIALSGADQSAELVTTGIVNSKNHELWLKGIKAFAQSSVGSDVKLHGSAVSGLCLAVQKNLPVLGGNMILLFSTLLSIGQETLGGSEQEVVKAVTDVRLILQAIIPHIKNSPNGAQLWQQLIQGLGEVAGRLKSVYNIEMQ